MSKLPAAAAYPTSKTALNSLTVQYAKALAADHILVNAVAPGPCATDFTKGLPYPATRTAAQGAEIAVRLATIGPTARPVASSTMTARYRGDHQLRPGHHPHAREWLTPRTRTRATC